MAPTKLHTTPNLFFFVALQVLSIFYNHFADDTKLCGIEKPVAVHPMIFILLLFHTNSTFSIVGYWDPADTIHTGDATPLANIVLTYYYWYDDSISLTWCHIRTSLRTKDFMLRKLKLLTALKLTITLQKIVFVCTLNILRSLIGANSI